MNSLVIDRALSVGTDGSEGRLRQGAGSAPYTGASISYQRGTDWSIEATTH
jgi:hypothetical protein